MKKLIQAVYYVVAALLGVTGIYLNVTRQGFDLGVFAYYTIQSNTICIIAAFFYVIQLFSHRRLTEQLMATIQGGVVMCILLTFLVFHFVLLPTISEDSDILGSGNVFVHYVVPLMIFCGYLLFNNKGLFRFKMILLWVLIPLAYCIFVFVYSGFGGRFGSENHLVPYFFLDYTQFGVGGVVLWILAFALGYIALSILLIGIDKVFSILSKIQK